MPTTTTNFAWEKPIPFSATDEDLWGYILNSTIDDIDSEVFLTDKVGKKTIPISGDSLRPTVSNGAVDSTATETTSGRPDIVGPSFSATADQYVQFQIPAPKSYNNSTITAQFLWTTAGTNTGTVIWQIEGVAVGNDDTIDVAYGTAVTVTDNGIGTAEDMHITDETSAVTLGGSPATGDMLYFRVARLGATDTCTDAAILLGIRLNITTNARNDV